MANKIFINALDGRVLHPTGKKAYHSYTKFVGGGGEIAPMDIGMRDTYIQAVCGNECIYIKQSNCIELEIE